MKLKENLRMLLERIKLSNFDYLTMKEKSKRFDNMLAAISLETNSKKYIYEITKVYAF